MDQDLAERVNRLERENRHLKMVGLGVLSIAAVALLLGQARATGNQQRTLKAAAFEVVDQEGAVLARLGIRDDPIGQKLGIPTAELTIGPYPKMGFQLPPDAQLVAVAGGIMIRSGDEEILTITGLGGWKGVEGSVPPRLYLSPVNINMSDNAGKKVWKAP